MTSSLKKEMDFAAEVAWRAGRLTLGYFQSGVEAELKQDESPVTIADREAEQEIRQLIRQAYPDDGILGEEFGKEQGNSGRVWIVDPIDGTKTFVQGVPLYGVLIGLDSAAGVLVGAAYMPAPRRDGPCSDRRRVLVERSEGAGVAESPVCPQHVPATRVSVPSMHAAEARPAIESPPPQDCGGAGETATATSSWRLVERRRCLIRL